MKISALIRLIRIKIRIPNPALRKEFKNQLAYLNFRRLTIFLYFFLPLILIQLYTDFYENIWSEEQSYFFKFFDISMTIITISAFTITQTRRIKDINQILPIHKLSVQVIIHSILIWSALVTVIESSGGEIGQTYTVSIYALSILFIIKGYLFLIYLSTSLVAFMVGVNTFGAGSINFSAYFFAIIASVIVAWIISRILYYTRQNSYIINKKLEIARNTLDHKVKERTQELYENNILLQKEINERKKYERELKKETKKAQEADRLKSVFLANMSHEIRTPLNGIMGFSELLINPNLKQDKKERYIDIVKSNGQQLLKIIDDILDISMIESNQLKVNLVECRVRHIYLETLDFFANYKKTIGKNQIKLFGNKEKINDELKFITDPSRLQQVINNLMKNAFKFTNKGHVKFGYDVKKDNVVFFIEDTGIGIEKEKANAIFERFRQGEENMNRSYTGTGLGLAISKGIIDMLRGKIWIDTLYKEGSRFCFSLPLRYQPVNEEENNHFEPTRKETHNLKN